MFRWALLSLTTLYCDRTLYLTAITNLPFISVLRYTPKDPAIETHWPERRGIPHLQRDKYLRDEWRAIRQNEAGPVIIHTFTWNGWIPGLQYNYLFTALPIPWIRASHSPLFSYTAPPDPTYQTYHYEPWSY